MYTIGGRAPDLGSKPKGSRELSVHRMYMYTYITHVSQITMLYILNLHSAVCQLYLSKTGVGGGA